MSIVRPALFPDELAQDDWVEGMLPGSLNLAERIHAFRSKQEKRALRQLVTEERVNQVDRLPGARPFPMHENGRQKWQPGIGSHDDGK